MVIHDIVKNKCIESMSLGDEISNTGYSQMFTENIDRKQKKYIYRVHKIKTITVDFK